jgi:hypothetical protein
MKQKQQALPEFTIDVEGRELAHVALANSNRRATLYAEDYRRLIDAGFSRHWSLTGTSRRGRMYPTLYAYDADGRDRAVTVARLILDAPRGRRVEPIDGDALNMRGDNLEQVRGAATFGAADWYPSAAAARAANGAQETEPRKAHEAHGKSAQDEKRKSPPPNEPAAPYMPRVVDRAALSARVKAMHTGSTEGGP